MVSSNLLINNNFIAIYLPITILITTFIFFFSFLILNHYGIFFEFNSKASIFSSLSSPLLYLSVILIFIFSIIIDYSFKLFRLFFSKSLSSRILLSNLLKKHLKNKKSYYFNNNNISSKSFSNCNNNGNSNSNNKSSKSKNMDKIKNRNSANNAQISSNILNSKSQFYILSNMNNNDMNIKKKYNSNKIGNDIISLELKRISKVFNYEGEKK